MENKYHSLNIFKVHAVYLLFMQAKILLSFLLVTDSLLSRVSSSIDPEEARNLNYGSHGIRILGYSWSKLNILKLKKDEQSTI